MRGARVRAGTFTSVSGSSRSRAGGQWRTVGEGAEDGGAAGAVVLVDVVDGARSGAAPGAGAAVGGVHGPAAAAVAAARLISLRRERERDRGRR
jgi:hypothetical protein